ncbi:type II toxin-antitoxin system death-on-curing family toxin [Thalassobacillus sp. B23F22_16]|uniref:type II toxin-antitoxin system death-on-curing family toxin n=1 Tax=Thalassobacillus sp. B23F22_16 TaxID=3459513 RepID=UPI00373E725A
MKDQGLFESAVHRAFEKEAYITIFDKAAALFESLARNYCFHNGNKRTAFASLDIFLNKNGYKLRKNDHEIEEYTVAVAKGKAGTISDIAGWLEVNSESDSGRKTE